jgi:hypothetical protein
MKTGNMGKSHFVLQRCHYKAIDRIVWYDHLYV